MFLSRTFSIICMFFNILRSFLSSRMPQFLFFTVDVNENRSCLKVSNLYRVTLSQPTAPIQCKFSIIMFLRFISWYFFVSH